ncbi:hypothetical protein GCM10010508_62690 [Streptomyces naganishii JCM 4654]|uniref:Uncharacterized protein n=1 Tax=Streptomyces naganishii JCM 4654 TaxID=1306179 RepID=A0A919CYY3_9ACTN|nr:hypothetical protein GCM10010508_62690 [Streptomyces naganishii JCM 4654]
MSGAERRLAVEHWLLMATENRGRARLEWEQARDDAEFLGRGRLLGVPALDATSPDRRSYWCVEMNSAGDLAAADTVAQLVQMGRYRLPGGERLLGG